MILIFFIFISIETRIGEANANSYPNTPPGGIGYYRVDDFSIQDFTINEIAFFQAVKSRIGKLSSSFFTYLYIEI